MPLDRDTTLPVYSALSIRREPGVDWVTLNRPEVLNALNDKLVDELLDYFGRLYFERQVRVVVLRGAGRAFCAGLDLKSESGFASNTAMGGPVEGLLRQRRISEIVIRMRRAQQPIISLVHGPACGGGLALALASDIRIAGESARMNAAFIRLGLSACDIGVSYFLPRLVGTSIASELLLTGRFINADRALRVGLVSEVVADDQLEDCVRTYIEEMLTTSPIGLRLTKECLNMSIDAPSLESAIAMEDRNQILCTQTSDIREGVSAFLGKRRPVFTDS
jgi:enoyl-CoA hydratase/carnithine racemase